MILKKPNAKRILKYLIAITIAVAMWQLPFYWLESFFYDIRFRISPSSSISNNIILIKIDSETLRELGRYPNLIDFGLIVRKLKEEDSKYIIPAINIHSLIKEATNAEKIFFANITKETKNFLVALDDLPMAGDENLTKLSPPLENIKIIPAPISTDKVSFAGDNVARRVVYKYEGKLLLPAIIANEVNQLPQNYVYRGTFDYKSVTQTFVNFRKKGMFAEYSFLDVLEGKVPPNILNNKIVLIGYDAETFTEHYVFSPFSKDTLAMSKLEVLANYIETFIQDDGVSTTPPWLNYLITIFVALFTAYYVFNHRPAQGLIAVLIAGLSFTLIAWAIFALFRVSITMTHPLLAIFVSYYFFIPYRLIQESRKSWEYQQKHKLLTEVERLKTNFLSMMSHDLKTPLARIQGMADVALAHPETLRPEQNQALKTISSSTQELTTFISSILDLSRVESEQVKLHLQSKDVNALLDELLTKYEDQAKLKNITFVKEFEPLFSIKIDVDLMRQVFSNLIENALKYSEPNSKVLVSTEEIDGKIVVQVADQGIGIPADEIENVFLKFYRTDNVKNSPIKGSGLGLFLAKYFVELHKGDISVESEPKQGSTFTVSLPMQ